EGSAYHRITESDRREATMAVSEATYRQLSLEDPDGHWELHWGALRQKPPMSWDHNELLTELSHRLYEQLPRSEYRVRANLGQVRRSAQNYYIPDVYVVPATTVRDHQGDRSLEVYEAPLPLVIEIWSPSTGEYDVEAKLPEYQRRGDLEVWQIHPYD